jgi:hypothetical protein
LPAALRDQTVDEQSPGLAHAIVYPTETKPTGVFKNRGNADALDGNSNCHQSVVRAPLVKARLAPFS